MNKIETVDLHSLRKAEHYQFITEVNALINTHNADELGIASDYLLFREILLAEETILRTAQSSQLTTTLKKLNKLRYKTWNGINKRVKATLESPFPDEEQSAVLLCRVIRQFGDPRKQNYNEASTAIANLLDVLMLPANAANIASTCIINWMNELQKQNLQFISLVKDRNAEFSAKGSGNVTPVRNQADKLYKTMVETIEAQFSLKKAKPVTIIFVNELNQCLRKYKKILAARKTRSSKKKKVEG